MTEGSKALLTFGVGPSAELLDISRPLFVRYAARHGYAYIEVPAVGPERPPSWMKVANLIEALATYDEVLWLDADVAIVDGAEDIAAHVHADAWQAMVIHSGPSGDIPNCGVWLVRKPMVSHLHKLWGMESYINHYWWEQGAMHELLGYTTSDSMIHPEHKVETELYKRTCFLPLEWNSLPSYPTARSSCPKFVHGAGEPHSRRVAMLRKWVNP